VWPVLLAQVLQLPKPGFLDLFEFSAAEITLKM
jgi:hypothetical protein